MLRVAAVVFVILSAAGASAGRAVATSLPELRRAAVPVVIEHATVIDVRAGRALPDRDIVIARGRIVAVGHSGRAAVPSNAQRIDGRERFVIPGLWDMHVHLTDATEVALPVLVAHGVTGVRDMGGDLARLDRWRREASRGGIVAPRIIRPGPYLDGPKEVVHHLAVADSAVARRMVDSLAARGVDFIKVHNAVPRDVYFEMLQRARERNLRVCGHVPATVTPHEASDAGQASIEHFATLFEGTYLSRFANQSDAYRAMPEYLNGELDTLASTFSRNRTWFTPTLVAYAKRAERARLAASPDSGTRWIAASLRQQWDRYFPLSERDTSRAVIVARTAFVQIGERIVAKLQAAGVEQLAGTDLGARDVIPGASLYEELGLLVNAGLTPAQALASATHAPARFLGLEQSVGVVEAGCVADLVILDANPLAEISNLRSIRGVVLAGRYFDRRALDEMLAKAAASAGEN